MAVKQQTFTERLRAGYDQLDNDEVTSWLEDSADAGISEGRLHGLNDATAHKLTAVLANVVWAALDGEAEGGDGDLAAVLIDASVLLDRAGVHWRSGR